MYAFITITSPGVDIGPFNIYSDVDGFISAFEINVDLADLLVGFATSNVPDGTTIIRVMSGTFVCYNYVDTYITTTTTTTTTV